MTLYRVIDRDAISINGKEYKLKGGVTASLQATYPPKQISGDYTQDSQPYASVHTWHDFRGGTGIDRWLDGKDDSRSWFSTCATRQRNHLTLPALASQSANAGGVIHSIAELAGSLYAVVAGLDINKYDNSGDTWGTGLATPGGTPVYHGNSSVSNAQFGASRYIIFGNPTGYNYSTDGATWSASAKNAYQLVVWDDKLWGLDADGQLWRTSTVGSGEVDVAKCPTLASAKISLFVGPDASGEPIIYAYSGLGLFAYDADNDKFIQTGVPVTDSTFTTGPHCVVWNGKIYVANYQSLLEYDPRAGTVTAIGPDRDDGLPDAYRFFPMHLTATPGALMVGTFSSLTSRFSLIWEWNGQGWQVVVNAGNGSGAYIHSLTYSSAYSVNRLWYVVGSSARLRYIGYSGVPAFPKQDADFSYASAAFHKTPWFDAGQNEVTKTLLEVQVVTQDCDANDTVKVEIAYDYTEGASDASYTTLGTITTNGKTTYELPDSTTPEGKDFSAVRIKLTLAGGASTTSPDVESVTLVYRKKLAVKTTQEFTIDLSADYKDRTPKQMRTDLVTVVSSTKKVQLTFRDDSGNTRNYFVDLVRATGLERSAYDEKGEVSIFAVEP